LLTVITAALNPNNAVAAPTLPPTDLLAPGLACRPYDHHSVRYSTYSTLSSRFSRLCAAANGLPRCHCLKPYMWSTSPYSAYGTHSGQCSDPPGMVRGRRSM
jgi:hypothetical protein